MVHRLITPQPAVNVDAVIQPWDVNNDIDGVDIFEARENADSDRSQSNHVAQVKDVYKKLIYLANILVRNRPQFLSRETRRAAAEIH